MNHRELKSPGQRLYEKQLEESGGTIPWSLLDVCTRENLERDTMELMDEDYVRLALSFPSIRNCPGLTEALKSAASPYLRTIAMLGCLHSWLWKGTKGKLEETERQACLFILSLWRRRDIWPEFDLYRALEVWDDQHRAAFQSWVTNFQRP